MKLNLLFSFVIITFQSFAQSDSTTFALTLDEAMPKHGNAVYCSSSEFLWKELSEYLGVLPMVEEANLDVASLNKSILHYQIPLEQPFWFAHVGTLAEGIVDSISNSYSDQFGIDWSAPDYENEQLIGHAFLKKNCTFSKRLSDEFVIPFGNGQMVKGIGLIGGWKHEKEKHPVQIHDYINKDNFIVKVGCKDSLDEIYFAKIPPEPTLIQTYNKVLERTSDSEVRYLGDFDELQIPYLNFDLENQFENLIGAEFSNESAQGLTIQDFRQRITFDLGKDGVRLESKAATIIDFAESDEVPVVYAFDQPFLVILKRKNSKFPYFMLWVDNTQLMKVLK